MALAERVGLRERIDAMFWGRPHQRHRGPRRAAYRAAAPGVTDDLLVDGQDVVRDVHEVLDRMGDFADRVRSGSWTGHTGERIRNVVNIGIGGSDLGPAMAYDALRDYADRSLTMRFVSNIDPTDVWEKTHDLDPARRCSSSRRRRSPPWRR